MDDYYPGPGSAWETVDAADAGMKPAAVAAAVAFAESNESGMDRDIAKALASGHFSEPWPDGEIIGPTKNRGAPSGLIVRHGRIVAEWGPTDAADMTFSVAKSYLSLCAGIAAADGLIPDLDRPVGESVRDGHFDSPQNRQITWTHLLQQTSEWEGTLWGKADRIDRNRELSTAPNAPSLKGTHRDLQVPGHFWEYNDIRVNVLSLALLRVLNDALPNVLKRRIMDPIGASETWEWHGYRNSYVDVGGRQVQSVSGGAHWGGGMMISSRDHARVGLLMARQGQWRGQQLLPADWVTACTTPCPIMPGYGFLWWLNKDRGYCPPAPASSYFAIGVGRNLIWIDPELDLVVVARWLENEAFAGLAEHVMAAFTSRDG